MAALGKCLLAAALMISALWSFAGEPELSHIQFKHMRVSEVLDIYQQHGVSILYSTGVVKPTLLVPREVPPGEPIERLSQILSAVKLSLQLSDTPGPLRYTVVPQRTTEKRILHGRVIDDENGRALVGVRVELAEQVVLTDDEGRFSIQLVHAQQPVLLSYQGYQAKSVAPAVARLLEIGMTPAVAMDEIVVVSSRYDVESARTRSHLVDVDNVAALPVLGEDPIRIANYLPGTASIGVSAKPHIRGGLQDELLVLFNNMELLEPFHLRDFKSLFSSFNPSLIQSIEVYTGGFPARYGDRMSGVMDIRPTHSALRTGGEVSLSLLNLSALVYGNYADKRGEWIVSARRGNLDIVTEQVNSTLGDPSYSDWFGQIRFAVNPDTDLDIGLIAYNDDIELTDFDEDGEIARSEYRNLYGWVQLQHGWSERVDSTTIAYVGRIDHNRNGVLSDLDADNGEAFVNDRRDFQLWSVGQFFRYRANERVFAEIGLRYTRQRASYKYAGNIERGVLARFLGVPMSSSRRFQLSPDGASGGVFGSVRVQLNDWLALEGGLRWDYQGYGRATQSQLSPRFSIKMDLNEYDQVRLSAGRFFQPEAIHELQVEDGITDYQDAQYADHIIAGWHHQFGHSNWSLRTEAFHKNFHKPKRRFENLLNPFVLLPELASDRVELRPSRARAAGLEVTMNYDNKLNLQAWLTYVKSDAEDRIGGRWQSRAWDQGDSISAGVVWHNERWAVSAALLWNDGWYSTRLPAEVGVAETPEIRSYDRQLRDYFSLDLKVRRTWRWQQQSLTAFLEVTNTFGRHNVGGLEYDVELSEDGEFYELDSTAETLLPLVPSLGINWKF